ncbi:MAG TPA: signal peptidase I [Solirubrobacteraceae bacterium]|nr:signal peptidase I [Solirubrobacteraceae bacterium]
MSAPAPPIPVTIPTPPRARIRLPALVAWTATGIALLLGTVMFLPAVLGLQRYVITGGSMTGTYDRGSVVFDEVVPPRDLRVGDVITYKPPPGAGPTGLVTHRIRAIRVIHGRRVYRTKGDANSTADPWVFTLPDATQARVVFSVPLVGYLVAALSDRTVRMLVIGLPALLIGLGVLAGLWRDAGLEARRRREGEPGAAA